MFPAIFGRLAERFRKGMRKSSHVHLRENPAGDTKQLVELIDRFIDGPMRYPLEWDDFISWENENPHIEQIRDRIGQHERLLFSRRAEDRIAYANVVIAERNMLAAMLGLPQREALS